MKITIDTEGKTLEQIKIEFVKAILEKNNGNKTKTAEQLEIGRSAIYRLIKE
jgi:transcriptional regulator with PAS, ATPase and Fis domain